jgi:hypothetical protein
MKFKLDLSKLRNPNFSFKKYKTLKMPRRMQDYLKKAKAKGQRSNLPSLSLSKRDFMLLGLLLLGLEGYGLYHYFISSEWQKYSDLHKHYTEEETIAKNFARDIAQESKYLENQQLLEYKLNGLTQEIPTEILQEEIIITLNKLAKDRELEIDGIQLSPIFAVSKQDFAAGKTSDQTKDADNTNTPKNVDKNIKESSQGSSSTDTANKNQNVKAAPKVTGNMILVEELDISFSGSYGALYNFLSDLEQSQRKIIVKEITMTRAGSDSLKGELKIQYVSYTMPEEKSMYSLDIPPIGGKPSPFQAYQGFADNAATSTSTTAASGQGPSLVKTYNPNFYLLLSTYDDNAPKIIMGDYTKNGTEIYSNVNAPVRGKLAISGNQDNMTYSYSLGGTTQTKNAKLMITDGKLQLEVVSHNRKNEQDKVGLILDVDNKTNYPLEIKVVSDDQQSPRFSLGTQLGSVNVSR